MKRFLLLFAMVLALTGIATAAEQAVYTCTFSKDDNKKTSDYLSTWTEECDGKNYTVTNFNNNNWGWLISGTTDYMIKCGRKNNASIASIATEFAAPEAINKIEITINSITATKVNSIYLQTSTDANFSNPVKISTTSKLQTGTFVIDIPTPAENLYYKVIFDCASGTSNGLIQISKLVYYADVTTGPKDFTYEGFKDYTLEAEGTVEFTLPADAPEITFTSSNDAVADADMHGVYAYSAGTTEITAKWGANDLWNEGEAKFNVTVTMPLTKAELVFAHNEYNKLIGDEPFAVEYTYEGATNPDITFTSSDENVATVVKGEGEDIIITIVGAGTTTITATAAATAEFTEATATTTINVVDPNAPIATGYVLLTDLSQLYDGGKIIIVNEDATKAISTTQNKNNRAGTAVELKNDAIEPGSEVQIIIVEFGTGDNIGKYAFNVGSEDAAQYLYAASNSSNQLKTRTTATFNTITISSETTSVIMGGNSRNVLRFNENNGSPIFNCYSSENAGSQTPIKIYYQPKQAESNDPVVNPSIRVDGENMELDSSISLNGKTATITFGVPEGVEVWTRFTPTASSEQQMAKAEAQFTQYNGTPIELTEDGTFEYYTVANGKQSATKSIKVTGGTTAITEIEAVEGEVEYFDLMGRRVENPANGLYIRRSAGKVEKVFVK